MSHQNSAIAVGEFIPFTEQQPGHVGYMTREQPLTSHLNFFVSLRSESSKNRKQFVLDQVQFSGCKRAFTIASTKCQDLLGEPKPAMQTHPVTECNVKCRSSEIARRLRCRRMKPQTAGHGSFSSVFFLHSRRNLFCLRHVFFVHGIPRAYVERASST